MKRLIFTSAIIVLSIILFISCIIIFLTVSVPSPIDLDNYPKQIDYGTLTLEEQELFNEIIESAESEQDVVWCDERFTGWDTWKKLSQHLQIYYGTDGYGKFIVPFDELYVLQLPYFYEAIENKVIVEARVDEALLNMRDGSDRYKLWQISKYLANRITYTDGTRDAISGLNGNGVCATYAILFYKMATRLGIQCYYCSGYAGGGFHAWNMVVLDGEEYFYDVTWFDNVVHDYRYLHSPTAWGREYTLNGVKP